MYGKPAETQPLLNEAESDDLNVIYNPRRHLPFHQQRRQLPIYAHREEFLWAVECSKIVLVVGEPGSGKSTQLPQYLHEAGWCNNETGVVVVVPRRIAASTLAERVAEEMGNAVGEVVGFATSMETKGSLRCPIRYVTDGVLLREIMTDPLLLHYGVVIMDDCHERRCQADLVLALLKKIQKKRRHLRAVICSATIDTEVYADFFRLNWMTSEIEPMRKTRWDKASTDVSNLNDLRVISIQGRTNSLKIYFLKEPCPNYIQGTLETILTIHRREKDLGSILAFLPGKHEVELINGMLKELEFRSPVEVTPLYGGLPSYNQLMALRRPKPNHRKIILSTNIAESSVTIDGVSFVIDCGYVKTEFYDPITRIKFLGTGPISKASAQQRAGRAGRDRPGYCYRLYTEKTFATSLPNFSVPEIIRTNLSSTILYLLALGVDNLIDQIEFPTSVTSANITASLTELKHLEAIDEFGKITHPLGLQMAELPIDLTLSRFLLKSAEFECTHESLIICGMLTAGNPWQVHSATTKVKRELLNASMRSIGVHEGDLITLYNIYKQVEFYRDEDSDWIRRHYINPMILKKADRIITQLRKYLQVWKVEEASVGTNLIALCKAIAKGFFLNAAYRQRSGNYQLFRLSAEDQKRIPHMKLSPESVTSPNLPHFIVYHEAMAISTSLPSDENTLTQLSGITVIDPKWLPEVAAHFYRLNAGNLKDQISTEISETHF